MRYKAGMFDTLKRHSARIIFSYLLFPSCINHYTLVLNNELHYLKNQDFKILLISCFIPSVSFSWRSCPLYVLKGSEWGNWSSTTIWCVALCCFMKWCETKPAIFSSSLCGMYLPGCIVDSFSWRTFSRASSVSFVEHTNNRPSNAPGKMKQFKFQIYLHTPFYEENPIPLYPIFHGMV